MMNYIKNFSVGYQNIHGLHDQLGCKAKRLECELRHDIEILSEIWGCNCKLDFGEYEYEIIEPQKHAGVKKGRKSGGFIILIKKHIDRKLIKFFKISNNFVWIEVSKNLIENLNENLLIIASYINDITSTYYDDEIFEELNNDVLTFCNGENPVLLMGDLNSRTGELNEIYVESENEFISNFPQKTTFLNVPPRKNCDKKEDSHGKKIISFCKSVDFVILNGRSKGDPCGNYTHLNFNNGPSAVDYGICNENGYELIDNFLILPMNELSDHSKIVTIFKDILPMAEKKDTDKYKWKTRGILYEWDEKRKKDFLKEIKSKTKEIYEISQHINAGLIHSTGEKIQQIFLSTAKTILKVKNKNITNNCKRRKISKKWFDDDCKKLKTDVRSLGKQKYYFPNDNFLRQKYHEKLKLYKRTCTSKKYFYIQDTLREIDSVVHDSSKFWQKWKKFSETNSNKPEIGIPGNMIFEHYSKLHSKQECDNEIAFQPVGKKNLDNEKLNQPFSKKEFRTVIDNLKINKSEGYDGISNEMIKEAPEIILELVNKFMNVCLEKSLIPNTWTQGLITLIHKKGDKNNLDNYRGICVSSALLKILCSLLNNRIENLSTEYNLISKNQIGFQKDSRTSDHILTLKAVVKKYVTVGKKKLYTCFVDFEKAFDSVWHKGLFKKLHSYGIKGKSLNLIFSLYNKTKCAIKVNNQITDFFRYEKGVRQGCPLSPLLFNLYINDLIDTIDKNSLSNVYLKESNPINALLYADDLVLISESKEGLQNQIDTLHEYCERWKLKINTKKTKSMIFNRGNKIINANFKVGDTYIENVKTFTYLGFVLSAKNCHFQRTMDDLNIKANRAIFALRNGTKLSKLPVKLALKIFNTQIVPILLYGSEVWGPYIEKTFKTWDLTNIERTQSKFLKQILGCNYQTSNDMVRADTGCRPLITQIITRHISYIKNIKRNTSKLNYDAFMYEKDNFATPNFTHFLEKFDINTETCLNSRNINKLCHGAYDRCWKENISNSSKAVSFYKYKFNIYLDPYLLNLNPKLRIALSRFRLSNHSLWIEKGRHMKPIIERNKRFCDFCKTEIEDEHHFLILCPLYSPNRIILENVCRPICNGYDSLNENAKFIFIMSNENKSLIKALSIYVSEGMRLRDKMVEYFFT